VVVEDDPAASRLIELSLMKLGLGVHTTSNGESALSFLQANPVDLLCLDLMLPNRSGFEVCELIRKSPMHASLPIIVISARAEADTKAYAEEAGANAYLVKPFKRRDLEVYALRLLGLRPPRRPAS